MAACDPSVYDAGKNNWGEQIGCLKKDIEALKIEIKGASREATNFTNKLGSSGNVMKDMLNTIGDMRKRMQQFTIDTSSQYDLAEKIAMSYKKAGLEIGLSIGRSKDFSKQFKLSVADVARFGGEISDVQGIYQEFAESSGRVRILGEDEVSNIFQLGKAANLVGNEATNLYETLELMGVSNTDATDRLEQVIIDSQSVGLNSSKVIKTLSSNMNKMQTYSFSSGVKGMTKMAQLAVTMRMDVGEMLGMADKFYQPEAAIEAAANLQMLGGDIAEAFGDPFETMYLARNKPEELAEKVSSMVENMMTFNKETGQYDFPAEARMQLKAAGDQLGINVDSMIEMTRQSAKIKDVKEKLSMTGMFSDKEMEGISNMARMEGGEFKVDMYDEDGKKLSKSLDELNKSDVEMLMKSPQGEEDYMDKMVNNSMTTIELLKSIEDSFQKTFVGKMNVDMYQIIEQSSIKTMEVARDMTIDAVSGGIKGFQDSVIGVMGGFGVDAMKKSDAAMAEYLTSQKDFLKGVSDIEAVIENGNFIVTNAVTSGNPAAVVGGGGSDGNPEIASESYCQSVGKSYDAGTNKCIPQKQMAKGGIVTKPTRALIGEGGEPEAVFPLSKLDKFINTTNTSSEMKISGTATININIKSDNPSLDISSLKDTITKTVNRMLVNGGQPDGANIPQVGGSNVLQNS